ncbi:MAG: patatin-like phospholipase family protein [Planctomycetaceae bacterium]
MASRFAPSFRARLSTVVIVAMCCASLVTGCAMTGEVREAVPRDLVDRVIVPGYNRIRFWGDDPHSMTDIDVLLIHDQKAAAAEKDPSIDLNSSNALTISGGASNGAFGAGILAGWTQTGNRPRFDTVTGISTGALIAPFVFLGPEYDDELTEAFTTINTTDVLEMKSVVATFTGDSFVSSEPLRHLVEKYITDEMLDNIAREHGNGRRLLIGTTNIDADRPVIWDMGAIATSGMPDRKKLFQDILIASAAIPGVFPPARLSVTADGHRYEELHVDGGTSHQVFLMPAGFSLRDADRRINHEGVKRRLFIIRNGRTTPEYSVVKASMISIAGKSISSLTKNQGVGDLYRLYAVAQRDDIDYNYVDIPVDFQMKETVPFDPIYMRGLYRRGYDMAILDVPWEKVPPGFAD